MTSRPAVTGDSTRVAGLGRWGWVSLTAYLFGCLTTGPVRAEEQLERFEFLQIRMGIPVNIVVYAPDQQTANEVTTAAYARIREIDRIMSDYDPDSALMRLCDSAQPGEPIAVPPELWTVLDVSQTLWKDSAGAFDVSVGPLVKLWRSARRFKRLPDPDVLTAARSKVGFQHVSLDPAHRTVTLGIPGMRLDLGGIAKGYAADAAIAVLKQRGLPRALVEAGGDITVAEPPPGQTGWRIELERLKSAPDGPPLIIMLKNAAVATSGDAYQYLEIDGVRYSHLINPHTGLGLTTPGSVTVIAENGMRADGLASAISVLGPERGLRLAKDWNAAAYIMHLGPDGRTTSAVSADFFDRLKQ